MIRNALLALALYSSLSIAAEAPLVAVASNLSHTLTEITSQFEQTSGVNVKLSFGSSANFARQILQGAPYQLFLSADKKYVDMLLENGHQITKSKEFARGRIGFFIPNNSRLSDKPDIKAIVNAIEFNQYRRLVIANPAFAPYGLAAQQALKYAGVWVIDKNKLLMGENAAQAMQFSLSGSIDIGIIPASYAELTEIKNKGHFFLIPDQWHQPIRQYLVLLTETSKSSNQFYNYLLAKESQTIIKKYGYTVTAQTNE